MSLLYKCHHPRCESRHYTPRHRKQYLACQGRLNHETVYNLRSFKMRRRRADHEIDSGSFVLLQACSHRAGIADQRRNGPAARQTYAVPQVWRDLQTAWISPVKLEADLLRMRRFSPEAVDRLRNLLL